MLNTHYYSFLLFKLICECSKIRNFLIDYSENFNPNSHTCIIWATRGLEVRFFFSFKKIYFIIKYITTTIPLPPFLLAHLISPLSQIHPSSVSSFRQDRVSKETIDTQDKTRYNKAKQKSSYWAWIRQSNRKRVLRAGKSVKDIPTPLLRVPQK